MSDRETALRIMGDVGVVVGERNAAERRVRELTAELASVHQHANELAARVVELEREKRELSCDLLTAHRETMEHAGRIIELEREVKSLRGWAWEDESKSTENMPDGYAP